MAAIQRRGGRSRRASAEINVVPYIDVMLVLLVIFMVAAPMVNPGVVDLPTVAEAAPQQTTPPIMVSIRADKSMRVSTGSNGAERTVTRGELLDFVRQRVAENPDQPVVIAAEKTVQYDAVMNVMSTLKADGIKRVGLLVKSQ
ncbi:protein TolR [Imbroritus primus]|uniref:Protein TolR n=1 Tax=Imbroritus primus TaxID=3058603 RepID=A0ACD3SPL4_9BURK|nr:protein TolR [Burkholderiaceae bacterium PBA]